MNSGTTRIVLPPPEAYRPRQPKVPRWAWALVVVLSLALGAWGGWKVGTADKGAPPPDPGVPAGDVERGASSASTKSLESPPLPSEKVTRRIAEAREAVASGDWLVAKRLFEEVRDMDPDNPDALASLPLIDRRLAEARGTVRVDAAPAGASVSLGEMKPQPSPAIFTGVPFGEYELRVTLENHDPVTRRIEVKSEEPIHLRSGWRFPSIYLLFDRLAWHSRIH